MLYQKKISLIIPCKNEEAGLYNLLQKVPAYVDEAMVVDNNSQDNTVKVALASNAKLIREERQVQGIGYGFSYQRGMKEAIGDYLVAMDGDNTYPVKVIKAVIAYMEKNQLDFVSCSRLPLANNQAINFIRRLGIQLLNLWAGFLYGYYFLDILSGMWVVRKEVVEKLNLKSGGWDLSPEIKLSALYNKEVKFSEYHIPYDMRINGRSKLNAFKTGFGHLWYILKRRLFIDQPAFLASLKPSSLARNFLNLFL